MSKALQPVEPWLALAAGSVLQACYDLLSPDAITAVDALLWWLSDESQEWLDILGYSPEPEQALLFALGSGKYAKKSRAKFSGYAL